MDAQDRLRRVEEHVRLENLHDLDGILGTFGAAARYDDEPWDEHHIGRDRVRAYYQDMLRAAPDLRIDVQAQHATSDAVILEVRILGTHLGSWRGLPATGRRVDFPLCGVYSFGPDGKIAGERIYYDRATVLRQLGVFREPTSTAGKILTPLTHPLTIARALLRRRA
jgi:steroid delta-isomerase-like uncharacterized protein